MKRIVLLIFLFIVGVLFAGKANTPLDWPVFMAQQDMVWDTLPQNWKQAPHFGNAMIGSMLYQEGDRIRLQVFRNDVHDHRDNTYGWTAYSRPKLQIGSFYLKTVGKPVACHWRKDLWNAELTGTIQTDKGKIEIRHFVHAEDMAIVTELMPTDGEVQMTWTWKPIKAVTTRAGYPVKQEQVKEFAKTYGEHYNTTLKLFTPNPDGQLIEEKAIRCWKQDFLAGGQYATAWTEIQSNGGKRVHLVSITHTYPESTAAQEAISNVSRYRQLNLSNWRMSHRQWWHDFYQHSRVTLPDKSLEALYWQTVYRIGCNARKDRLYTDTSGMWFQGFSWPYTTNDHNTQVAYWPLYPMNRPQVGPELVDALHTHRQVLIDNVRPKEWQVDSAFLHLATARDFIGPRDQDMRYWNNVGNLTWLMHNCWLQYRYTMDDAMLREKIYPLLRRSINLYRHMLNEGDDGKLHLQPTYSPETGTFQDCNFDLGLLKWGCQTLLWASDRLKIDDPLRPQWQDILDRTVDYPVDEFGFRLGADKTSPTNHRHGSHFIMAYPLYLVNIEQPGTRPVLEATLKRFQQGKSHPGMRAAYAGSLAASMRDGQAALAELKDLQGDLFDNGLWFHSPCIEVSLSAATIIHEMLIQSWGDKIRVFPAVPSEWKDVSFENLRTEGAFVVSAERKAGVTQWVKIKSLAGQPCVIEPGLAGTVKADQKVSLKMITPGVYEIDLKKGQEILLTCED